MGLNNSGWGVNPISLSESKQILVFPSDSSVASEIPLYLKFNCVEYSQNGLFRAGAVVNVGGYGNVKAVIAVPMPSKLTTQTAMRYKQEENPNVIPIGNGAITEGLKKLAEKQLPKLMKLVAGNSKLAKLIGIGSAIGAKQTIQSIDRF